MAKIPFMLSGAGDGSDDCTAAAADILEGKTAIYNGSDDDAAAGTMKDYSGTSTQATGSMNSSNSRVQMAIPNTGKYDTAANLYVPYSTMRTLIGYTDASKVLTGTTICGLAGTMADKSGTSTAATSSTSGSNVRLQIPTNAYYNTSAYLTNSYSNMASTISLTAAKIASSYTILGITGTAKEYTYTTGSYTFSSITTTRWVMDSGTTHSFGSFSLSNVGFTPQYVFGTVGGGAVMANSSSASIVCSMAADNNWTGSYPASSNSTYSFTSSSINIPLYSATSSSSNTFYYTVVGYK